MQILFAPWLLNALYHQYQASQSQSNIPTQLQHQAARADGRKAWLYVLFWNKFYVDEIYDTYIVNPIIRLAQWFSRWTETREIRQSMEKFSRQTMALGDMLALAKPRFIGHNILFLIFGFVFTMGLLYILS